jgi:hypothetical protein
MSWLTGMLWSLMLTAEVQDDFNSGELGIVADFFLPLGLPPTA